MCALCHICSHGIALMQTSEFEAASESTESLSASHTSCWILAFGAFDNICPNFQLKDTLFRSLCVAACGLICEIVDDAQGVVMILLISGLWSFTIE